VEALIAGTASFPSGGLNVNLARFQNSGWSSCTKQIVKPVVENCPTGRTCALLLTPDASTGFCYLFLNISAVSPSISTGTQSLWTSLQTYSITSFRDCDVFSEAEFVDTMTRLGGVDSYAVTVVSKDCGSTVVGFRCKSFTSSAAADATCALLVTKANTVGSDLNTALSIVNPGRRKGRVSDNALYAIFVLILLPFLCCVIFIWWYKAKQKEADDQYLQDTQTFTQQAKAPAHGPPPPYYGGPPPPHGYVAPPPEAYPGYPAQGYAPPY